MNLIIFHTHAIMQNSQGVSKVLITLRKLFREKGHNVIVVAMRRFETDRVDDKSIFFLPNTSYVTAKDNYDFLCKLMQDYHINATVNACTNSDEIQLIRDCCKTCKVPLTTCFHGLFLTPIYNIAAVKEYSLRKHHLTLVYYLLKLPLVVSLLSFFYILRYRKYYLKVYKLSDAIVLLSKTMEKEFLRMIGEKRSEKTFIIPNTIESEDQ